jgi:hypothetical protein
MNTRLRTLGGIIVEHLNGRDYGAADWQAKPRIVQHTTESGFESALAKLAAVDTPTFLAGRDKTGRLRCVQLLDIGRTAGALEHPPGTPPTNSVCAAQIELVGYSQRARWLPDPGVAELLAHLYAALHDETGVPLKHVANPKRDRATFTRNAGFYGHADIPDQPAGHWDPGTLDYVTLFRAARAELTQPGWYLAAKTLSPLWAWIAWRDHGAPEALRPAQIPARVPRAWWLRYAAHRGV